jgi:L-serine dehydratase
MALAGYDLVVPLDEFIQAVRRVGGQMPRELRCTALGRLSITQTAQATEWRLGAKKAAARGRRCGCD